MSVEVLPVGISCNLRCDYCYEQNQRDVNPAQRYDREAVLSILDKLPDKWSLFGGEALILPLPQIEELLKRGYDKWGQTGIQTNGVLITEAHIELFRKYKTGIGISLDGPDELNDSRWAGTLDATRKQTARTHWAIRRLCEEAKKTPHLLPSIIVTLHAGNCSQDRFPKFVEWIRQLDAMGIKSVNPHVMELDAKAHTLYLSQNELADRLIDLWALQDSLETLRFTKFTEVLKLLQGDDSVACNWKACDALNTSAVQAVKNDGTPTVCSRTFKGEQTWLPAEGSGFSAPLIEHPGTRMFVRQLALYVTPQEVGGCKDCEYWMMCQGNCPGEGEQGDWRMRSHYCQTFKRLFEEGARRLRLVGVKPVCDWTHRKHLEELMYQSWVRGSGRSFGEIAKEYKECTAKGMIPVPNGYHGDCN